MYQYKTDALVELQRQMALPVADGQEIKHAEVFDPWLAFPSVYGSYSSAFDVMAITVLDNLLHKRFDGEELAHEMFREMLCTADLCDYGSSPRVCFPVEGFRKLLPELVAKWKEYYTTWWKEPYPENPNG